MKRNFLRTVTFAAVLAVVSLAGRDFTDTNLSRCRLENSDLSNSRFIRTNLDSTVSGRSKFDGAIMMNCTFNNGMLAESSMYRAQADHRPFSDATIFATDFEGSNFQQCTFYNTNIIASRFKGLRSVRGITFKSGSQNRGRGEGIEFSTLTLIGKRL